MKILVVEDHADTAHVLARLLRVDGHDVDTAGGVGEAMTACGAHRFDLLLCDVGLPDGPGIELMRQLRASSPIRGIALTGYGMEDDETACLQAGSTAHLTKPIDFGTLLDTIRAVSK